MSYSIVLFKCIVVLGQDNKDKVAHDCLHRLRLYGLFERFV